MYVREDGAKFFVVDNHAHLGTNTLMKRFGAHTFRQPGVDNEALADRGFLGDDALRLMDTVGIDLICGFPVANPTTDYTRDNDRILSWSQEHPDRIVPYARLNPNFGPEHCVEQIRKYASQGIKGLKFHPKWDSGYEANDPYLIYPLVEEAGKHGLVCLFHTGEVWNAGAALVAYVAMDFPDVTIVCGHMGDRDGYHEAVVAAKKLDNFYLDTTEFYPTTQIAAAVHKVGAEKLLFGSDMPYVSAAAELDKITKHCALDDEQLALILGRNMARLLDLPVPDGVV